MISGVILGVVMGLYSGKDLGEQDWRSVTSFRPWT